MPSHTCKTTKEALSMIRRGWLFLLKKNPAITIPLSFWMIFGGFIFLYNYVDADKFTIREAKPIGALYQPTTPKLKIMPEALAETNLGGIPIIFNGQIWGYEDTTFTAKVAIDRPVLLVYDKISKKVYEVEFTANRDVKMQLQKRR